MTMQRVYIQHLNILAIAASAFGLTGCSGGGNAATPTAETAGTGAAAPSAASHFQLAYEVDFSKTATIDNNYWGRITDFSLKNQNAYTPGNNNLVFANGSMSIEARSETIVNPAYSATAPITSAASIASRPISSANVVSNAYYQYGRFEIVARVPQTQGVQPAIWLQGKNQGQYGEIDLIESIGAHNPGMAFATLHYGPSVSSLTSPQTKKTLDANFHNYTLEWTPTSITMFYDGIQVMSFDPQVAAVNGTDPLRQPMQLRLNLAMGTPWSGGPADLASLPVYFDIQSVRIWSYVP